jgi:glutaredoxin 3
LRTKGLDYEEIDITSDQARALEMIERSGRRTVPQIFIDDEPIGGFDELSKMNLPDKWN